MNRAKIVALCTLAACGYGIVHDQITVRVCSEYFSVAHPPLFPTDSPTLLALCWGVAATWWVGLALGTVLALVSHAGPGAPTPAASFYQPVGVLLAVMGLAAFAAGLVGYGLTRGGFVPVPGVVRRIVPVWKEARFVAAWCAHLTSYLVGAAGGALVCLRAWNARGRPAALALMPRGRAATVRAGCIALVGALVWWWRWRAH